MPRPRCSEMPQRQSPRGPHPLRTSSSSSAVTDRSPKLGSDRRSPRAGPHSDPPLQQKKLGTRIADLESQLGQAQEELKSLKDQLASAEAAKKEAEKELENKSTKKGAPNPEPEEEAEIQRTDHKPSQEEDGVQDDDKETDVFEVPVDKREVVEVQVEPPERLEEVEVAKPGSEEMALKEEEINALKAKLEEKEKELEVSNNVKEELKSQLNDAASKMSCAKTKEEEMCGRLSQLGEELKVSKGNEAELKSEVERVKEEKEGLEAEMKMMRVQTEQWRKAADAAAAVLAGGNGRMIVSERCASMDKHVFETPGGGYGNGGFVGSPGYGDDMDGGFGSAKQQRRGSGIKMFGDLWKKKHQK
ncbi:Interactor of constitutive active ROPs 4 [Linum perenne]